MPTLTKRQKEILDFIKIHINKRDYSPTFEEIKKKFRLSALSTVHQHVNALIKKGYLEKNKKSARALEIKQSFQDYIQIPLVGKITAGLPIEAIEEKEQTIALPKLNFSKSGEFFGLRVMGDSMIEENISDGDLVIFKKQSTANNGDKVVALIDNTEATLKKIYFEKNKIRLQPANKRLKPIFVEPGRLMVQGVVIDVIKNQVHSVDGNEKEAKKYIKLPLNKIIHGDVVEIMKQLPKNSIDLTVTSPPYDELRNYNGYIFDFENIAKNLFYVTKEGGVVIWVVGDKVKKGNRTLTCFRQALYFQKIGFNVHDVMIYKKKNTPFMRSNAYTNCYEFMFVLTKGSPNTFNPKQIKTVRQGQEMLPFGKGPDAENKKILKELKPKKTMTNIWEYAVGLHGSTSDRIAFEHPAIFPEKLAEDHILSWTNKKDVVFDPMCGSGTTCKMAHINSRHYIGCDISKEYVNLTKRRLKSFNL